MDAAISSRLPALLQAGLFDSRIKFAGQRATVGRVMTQYELELYLEEGGAVFVQGKRYPIRRGLLLCAKPGQRRSSELHFPVLLSVFDRRRWAVPAAAGRLPRCAAGDRL